ncbi:uncharacterized protein LOC142224529 [Haematobia irritans]|uniref:uncharacterized protein LOC142224529 n=1 Tax=Haematobia irritans TaxID=7368 RepID=UPI003F50BF5B
MELWTGKVLYLIISLVSVGTILVASIDLLLPEQELMVDYETLLQDIYQEKAYDSILLMHDNTTELDISLKAIHQYPIPKIAISMPPQTFCYKDFYNSEILVVYIVAYELQWQLLHTAASILDYMRQSRILAIAENIQHEESFKKDLLNLCQHYKITNVLLRFTTIRREGHKDMMIALKPYPEYHWKLWFRGEQTFFMDHWRNFHNKSIVTFVEQTPTRSLVFADPQGNIKMSGYVSMILLLFVEYYNASLQMLYPLTVGNKTHYTVINRMVDDNLLDIPMALAPAFSVGWRNVSDMYELNRGRLIVPLPQQLEMRELYGVLLNGYFFAVVFITSVLLSLTHYLIDAIWFDLVDHLNLMINYKIFPGVLGQSFAVRSNPEIGLKTVYLLVGFAGLYISTMFSANVSKLFITPSYHRQMQYFEDLLQSPYKLLLPEPDYEELKPWLSHIRSAIIVSPNISYVIANRNILNTTYCYAATSASFDLLWQQQKYITGQTYYAPENMILYSTMPSAFVLQYNSPYKEPLNYLIHLVRAVGLIEAWQDHLFWDMVKIKEVSVRAKEKDTGAKVLLVADLFWVWSILFIGLGIAALVFFLELWISKSLK